MLIRPILLLLSASLASCGLLGKKEKAPVDTITGDWLVLYPKHCIETDEQKAAYVKAQDSIVTLTGLKLLRFRNDGTLIQADSLYTTTGKWVLSEDDRLLIENAGKGLDRFKGKFSGERNDTMRITEFVQLGKERVKLVWHLKRLTKKEETGFFGDKENEWRKKPAAPETPVQLTTRVKAIVQYYAVYFTYIAKESIYFVRGRVPLPFKYYQHSLQLAPYAADGSFNRFFYDSTQAKQAYAILSDAMDIMWHKNFPSADNYVEEYAEFMRQLTEEIK